MSETEYRSRLAQRLAARVDKSGEVDACWPWTGPLYEGYGVMGARANGKYRSTMGVHVVAWALETGKWPSGRKRIVCHKCGNRACCNLRHLYLGTQKSNARDRVDHGTNDAGNRLLTDTQVRKARKLWASKEWRQYELAEYFGVSTSAMNYLLNGRYYQNVR